MPDLPKNGDTAELIGVALGDGHIEQFPRTQCLTIVGNANNPEFIARYANLVEQLFHKKPYVKKCSEKEAIRIRIYQKDISGWLGVPAGKRRYVENVVPDWIWTNEENLVRFLRGLYEAEGSFSIHKPTSTYKLSFANRNTSLLNIVHRALEKLGFHPHSDHQRVQLSRKVDVFLAVALMEFRVY